LIGVKILQQAYVFRSFLVSLSFSLLAEDQYSLLQNESSAFYASKPYFLSSLRPAAILAKSALRIWLGFRCRKQDTGNSTPNRSIAAGIVPENSTAKHRFANSLIRAQQQHKGQASKAYQVLPDQAMSIKAAWQGGIISTDSPIDHHRGEGSS